MDEDEWLESDEGQRWAEDFVRKGEAAARDMRKLAASFSNFGVSISEMRFDREAKQSGASERVVRDMLERAAKSE